MDDAIETLPDVTCGPDVRLDSSPLQTALVDALHRLNVKRAESDRIAEQLAKHREDFTASIAPLMTDHVNTKLAIGALEDEIRASTLVLHATTGEPKPVPGVQVKMVKTYAIDEVAGLAWARVAKMALIPESLDLAAVKKIAAATPLPFVVMTPEPRAEIASDLTKALASAAVKS